MPVFLISTTHIGNARFSYLNHPTPQSVCYVMPFADRVSCTNSESCIVWTRLYCYILRCVRVKLVKKQHREMLNCMGTHQNSPGTYQCQQNLHNYWERPFLWYKTQQQVTSKISILFAHILYVHKLWSFSNNTAWTIQGYFPLLIHLHKYFFNFKFHCSLYFQTALETNHCRIHYTCTLLAMEVHYKHSSVMRN